MPKNTYRLTDETVHILRITGVVWNGETSITDRHLAFPKRKREEAEFIEETAHGLHREDIPGKCDLNIVNLDVVTGIFIWKVNNGKEKQLFSPKYLPLLWWSFHCRGWPSLVHGMTE